MILGLGLLCAGGLAAIWWFGRGGDVPPVPVSVPVPGVGPAQPPTRPSPVPLTGPSQAADPGLPAGTPLVHVAVRALEPLFAPPEPLARVLRAGDGQPLAVELVGGTGHGFGMAPPRSGQALAIVDWPGTGRFVRQLPVAAADAAPRTLGARVVVQGMIYDELARPLGGAHVWLGELLADGSRREVDSDATGAFELDVAGGEGVPLVATADGRAAAATFLDVRPGVAPELRLAPETVLRVQFATTSEGLDGARVLVVPRGAVTTEAAAFPFWLQSLTGGTEVQATGGCLVRGLPATGDLGLYVWHPRLPFAAAYDVQRQGPAARAIVQLPERLPEVRGRLVDEAGAPLVGAEVWSLRPRADLPKGTSLRLLPGWLEGRGACRAVTGADGGFAIGAFAEPGARLALRAPGRAGRDVALPLPSEPLPLPRWVGGEPAFALQPPRAGVEWAATTNLGDGLHATLAADRPWVIALPHAGRFAFELVTSIDGVERARANFDDVAVTGPTVLAAPRVD